jgi:hypothetical protein
MVLRTKARVTGRRIAADEDKACNTAEHVAKF